MLVALLPLSCSPKAPRPDPGPSSAERPAWPPGLRRPTTPPQGGNTLELSRSVDIEEPLPAGFWQDLASAEWSWIDIEPAGRPDRYRVTCDRWPRDEGGFVRTFSSATWDGEALTMDPPLFAEERWVLRRSKEDATLLSETRVRSDERGDSPPRGMKFRRVVVATKPNWPPWGGVDFPEGPPGFFDERY